MPFLRGTTPIWSTQDLPRRFKEWKACLVEIGQTAHKLEKMPVPIFPWLRTWHINVWRMGGRNMPTLIFLWFTVAFRHNIESNSST